MLGCTSQSFCHQFQTSDLLLELAQVAVKMVVGELALGILPAGCHQILCCCRRRHQLESQTMFSSISLSKIDKNQVTIQEPGEFRRQGMQQGESRPSTPVTPMPQIIMMPLQHHQFPPLAPQQY